MRKILSEPLLAFLMLSGVIFMLYEQVSDNSLATDVDIAVTQGHLQAIALNFEKVWQRPPNKKELDTLVDNYIREEVFYREAMQLGLDKNDGLVRRRLQQKMEFIIENNFAINNPDDQQLRAYLDVHGENYRQQTRFSFQHIYFNPSQRDDSVEADALALLFELQESQLQASPNTVEVDVQGDALMIQKQFSDEAERDIERALGAEFLQSLRESPQGRWHGPILSSYGLHLVRIDKRFDGQIPAFDDVRPQLANDWIEAERLQSNEAIYQQIRQRYSVTVAVIPPPEQKNNNAEKIKTARLAVSGAAQ